MRCSAVRLFAVLAVQCLLALPALCNQDEKYTMKLADAKPPAQLKEAISALLEPSAVQVFDGKGELLCEVWFRKSTPAKATDAQVQNGLTYRELEQTTVLGAIRFARKAKDYRDQDVPAGVYTLRLAYQPQDGDHMGTAPYTEFCLVVAADRDEKPATLEPKGLHDLSAKSLGGNHPGVFLLFPNTKPNAKAELADQGMGHWVIRRGLEVDVNGKKAMIGVGLTVVGKAASA
jgi:hypothetical protein